MAIKITLRGRDGDISAVIKRDADKLLKKISRAVELAAGDVADEIKEKGDADISHAGNFGTRWTDSLQVTAHEEGVNSKVTVAHEIPYAHIFETGGVIKGNPLWIPFEDTDAKGVRARDYPGGLFKTTRKSDGLQLLGAIDGGEEPFRYFAKEQVTIPKKFHLTEICAAAAVRIGQHLKNRLR